MLAGNERRRISNGWIVAFLSIAAWPALAAAEEGTVEIAWSAPVDCPTTPEVEASIRSLLGRPQQLADGRHLTVQTWAARKHERLWSGTIETRLGTTEPWRAGCESKTDAAGAGVHCLPDGCR